MKLLVTVRDEIPFCWFHSKEQFVIPVLISINFEIAYSLCYILISATVALIHWNI